MSYNIDSTKFVALFLGLRSKSEEPRPTDPKPQCPPAPPPLSTHAKTAVHDILHRDFSNNHPLRSDVCKTEKDGTLVSTVRITALQAFGGQFETMVFGGELDGSQWRYATRGEAIAGHEAVCARVFKDERCKFCDTLKEVGKISCSKCGAGY